MKYIPNTPNHALLKVSPYELATLAARISPELCKSEDESDKTSAVHLASELLKAASRKIIRNESVLRYHQNKMDAERAFMKLYQFSEKDSLKLNLAARIITGHIEDRQTSTAIKKLKTLLRKIDVNPEAEQEDTITLLEATQVPGKWVVELRRQAELYKICKKKLLTSHALISPQNKRTSTKDSAKAPKTSAAKSRESARKPTKSAR